MAAEHCGVCRFYQAELAACRRNPPQVSFFPIGRDQKTGEVQMQAQTAFPTMQADIGWCGCFEPVRRIIQ